MELVKLIRLQWDRSLAIALAAVGGVMLFVGWFRVSDGLVVTQQVPYVVSAGLGGIFLLGIAATLWLSADFRDEWRALEDLSKAGKPTVGAVDPTLVESVEQTSVHVLLERIGALESRLAVLETKRGSGRHRQLEADPATMTPSLTD